MKRPYRLSPIDLANIALEAEEIARLRLRQIDRNRYRSSKSGGGGVWNYYGPLLALEEDIFNTTHGMLMRRPPRTLPELEAELERICGNRSGQIDNFLRIVRAIHAYVTSNSIIGRYEDFGQMNLGAEARFVRYWLNLILQIGDDPTAIFLDLRRNDGLSPNGCLFVFSAMEAHIRASNPGRYIDLKFGIIKVQNQSATLLRPDRRKLFTYAELRAAVDKTYQILREIEEERRAA